MGFGYCRNQLLSIYGSIVCDFIGIVSFLLFEEEGKMVLRSGWGQ